MSIEVREFMYNGHRTEIIIPEKPNGKWVWKTEFFYAFDQAERALTDLGYTRVYYEVSNMYGNPDSVRLMHGFHKYLVNEYDIGYKLDEKAILFGFSRGGLYAFNYSLFYPELVEKVYLDAPVLNVNSWPHKGSGEYYDMLEKCNLDDATCLSFKNSPNDNLEEFFSHDIPLLVVAGAKDQTVFYEENSKVLIDYCEEHGIKIEYIIKPECDHHPHSLEDVTPIVNFVEGQVK